MDELSAADLVTSANASLADVLSRLDELLERADEMNERIDELLGLETV